MATMFWMPLEPRIKCGIVTAWFNQRRNKMVIPDPRYSCFLETKEEHAFFRGWLTEFTDSDVVSLICPRPLLVQTGKKDGIAWWPQVIEEFDASKEHYQETRHCQTASKWTCTTAGTRSASSPACHSWANGCNNCGSAELVVTMLKSFGIFVLLSAVGGGRAEPIRVHPDNPHFYSFRGRPTVLVTSAEHYGAVINRPFDYVAYLDALKSYGLNYTRIYPAAFVEPVGTFHPENTLAPKPGDLIQPWARSETPGYRGGGNLFDLNRWDPEYFQRLKDFVAQADARDIVVEVCFFNAQNKGSWPMSPLSSKNNIQGEGNVGYNDVQTLKHPELLRRQDDFVRRIAQEVNSFDNVILEICDEPFVVWDAARLGRTVDRSPCGNRRTNRKGAPQEASARAAGDRERSAGPSISAPNPTSR